MIKLTKSSDVQDKTTKKITTTKKVNTKTKDATSEKLERLFYVGPNLSKLNLTFATTYINGIPQNLEGLITKNPLIKKLFVPLDKIDSALNEKNIKGSVINTAINELRKAV